MPEDFEEAYEGVLQAVASGRLTEERLDQSLRRILQVKLEWMETMPEQAGQAQPGQEQAGQEQTGQGEQDRPEMG